MNLNFKYLCYVRRSPLNFLENNILLGFQSCRSFIKLFMFQKTKRISRTCARCVGLLICSLMCSSKMTQWAVIEREWCLVFKATFYGLLKPRTTEDAEDKSGLPQCLCRARMFGSVIVRSESGRRRDKVLCWFRSMSFPTILNASCFDLGRHCNLNGIALYKLLQRPFSPDVFIFPKY